MLSNPWESDLDEIHPEEYSRSYRRLVLQDFTDEEGVADFTVRNVTKEAKKECSAFFDLLTRVNITRDAMDDDESLMLTSTNMTVVGCILLEFVNAFSEHMGWDAVIQEFLEKFPDFMRTGKTMTGKKMRPGDFSTSDVSLKQQGRAYEWGIFLSQLDMNSTDAQQQVIKAVEFMVDFFRNISKEKYTFFVENDVQVKVARMRNPREGSYPYGRTGKTPQDPLPGFLHFKYNKAGEPVVRVIKPGKHTPLILTPDGEAQTPYKECGSKMPREPNGKYRHIASYSMEELVALGWDGATYTSTRGKHAAVGHHVPFVAGYDSDEEDDYEPINVAAGKRAGVIGLPPDENGLYMTIPSMDGGTRLGKIRNGR